MIRLTRLNGQPITVNAELVQWIENSPDTVITLTSGEKLMVLESAKEVAAASVAYRRAITRPGRVAEGSQEKGLSAGEREQRV